MIDKKVIPKTQGIFENGHERNLVVCDTTNHIVRQMSFESSIKKENLTKSRIIGKVGESGLKDGNFEESRFNNPISICFLPNNPIGFISDSENNCIRMIDFWNEKVITIAGNKQGRKDQDGSIDGPYGIAIHKNQNLLFVSERNVISEVDISSMLQYYENNRKGKQQSNESKTSKQGENFKCEVSTVCGTVAQFGLKDGIGNEAKLNSPTQIAFSQLDENILYFCDFGNNCIRKVDIRTKRVSTIAGVAIFKNKIANEDQFNYPTGICVDRNENLFVCDYGNHSIRKLNFTSNVASSESQQMMVLTLFGNTNKSGIEDGNKSIATLKYPNFILYDTVSNSLIFTQQHAIRQIKLGQSFLERKLKKIFLIYRILFRQCESKTSKRLLLQLISIQILQIPFIEDNNNSQNQNKTTIITKQNEIIEYINSNSKLKNKENSKSILLKILFS